MIPKLLWIKNKYAKKSLSSKLRNKCVVTYKCGLVEVCSSTDIPKGIYKGNGIVQTYGKCHVLMGKKEK